MKKIFIIVLIFLLFINLFVCSSLAIDFEYNEQTYTLSPDFEKNFNYYLLYRTINSSYPYGAIASNVPFEIVINSSASHEVFKYNVVTDDGSNFASTYGGIGVWTGSISVFNTPILNTSSGSSAYGFSTEFLFSNFDVEVDGQINNSDTAPKFNAPSFMNTKEELASGNFDTLKIDAGDLDLANDRFVFTISNGVDLGDGLYNYYPLKSFILDSNSSFLYAADLNLYYFIPQARLGIDLSNDKTYLFELKEKGGDKVYSSIDFTVSGLSVDQEIKNSQDVTNDKLDEQTNAIKENMETNKNIFERIGEVLSYINPFSENFFVYKLIELLIDAIKSLFIPSDDFFSIYFSELMNWFSDRLGFLFYPFELIINILNKILTVNFTDPIFNVPDLYEPFTNSKLISSTTFNLNDMLTNDIFKTVHEIYFICVDAFIVFGLVNLAKRKWEEVTDK